MTHEYRFAVYDEEYPQGFSEVPEDEYNDEEDYEWWELEDEEDDGPFYDPQGGDYL